ncbi:hypothetical protein D3C86_1438480 [compost metagenome]
MDTWPFPNITPEHIAVLSDSDLAILESAIITLLAYIIGQSATHAPVSEAIH